MDPIDSISRVMQLLRRRLPVPGRSTAAGTQGSAPGTAAAAPQDVRDGVAARLSALDPQTPGYAERATELFVESVLLAEFGEPLTNDPQFRQVILGVAREMRAEPETARDLERLFETLRQA